MRMGIAGELGTIASRPRSRAGPVAKSTDSISSHIAEHDAAGRSAAVGASSRNGLAGGRALGLGVDGVERLAGGHEKSVALGPAEADVAADLGKPDAADELSLLVPHGDAAVAEGAAGVAGATN